MKASSDQEDFSEWDVETPSPCRKNHDDADDATDADEIETRDIDSTSFPRETPQQREGAYIDEL